MDDSFSLFAKSIRQNKINKEELLNNLKEISEAQSKKDNYFKNIIKIQKVVRGHLYRIKYHLSLDEINTKTIIDYLYEKKKQRIHKYSQEIISFFVSKYINKLRKIKKKDMLLLQYKIHCCNLIKARIRGVLVRKHIKEKLILIKKAKLKIIKQILRYRTILILKSGTMQNLLLEIGKIRFQLNNLENNSPKVKELKNKLSKNINLFHDTYYYLKENCNWIIEKKTSEKWNKKYFDIINKRQEKINNKNNKEMKSDTNGYSNYLQEFYNDSDNNEDNGKINKNITSNKKSNYSSTLNSSKKNTKIKEIYGNKRFESCTNVSEFKIEEKKKGNNKDNKKDLNKPDINDENNSDSNYKKKVNRKVESDKKINYSNNIFKKDINNIDLNNIANHKLKKEKEKINIYEQREERPIKPLKINDDILNCQNPFGLRENNIKKTSTYKQNNNFRNSMQYSHQFNNSSNQSQKRNTIKPSMTYRDLEQNNLQLKETTESEYNFSKTNRNFYNRDDKPIGGNKIDYESLFNEDGEINFVGDPFGGAKQFETDKSKIMQNKSNLTTVRKKPIYDARKAIEEAKIKEAKEVKIEKHTEFREFLKEMKKISAEEKLKNNEKNQNNNFENNDGVQLDIKKSYSENINKNGNEIFNGNNIYKNNYVKDEIREIDLDKKRENIKRENSVKKTTSNKMMRKKLHDLEKTPAPMLNLKEAKSKIECWFDKNSNNNGSKYLEYSNKNASSNRSNGQKKPRKENSNEYEEINKMIRNKKLQNKIENYVDKKLSQLNLQIDKINDVFSIESYFEQKEIKMQKYINVPYIKEGNMYVKNFNDEIYNDLINEIFKDYKNLK